MEETTAVFRTAFAQKSAFVALKINPLRTAVISVTTAVFRPYWGEAGGVGGTQPEFIGGAINPRIFFQTRVFFC